MATFKLASGQAVDLAFDAGSQTLTWLGPEGVVRWPMARDRWLKLACQRAGRNLSYEVWRAAYPLDADKNNTQSALVCRPLIVTLDRSFAEALVAEARQAIDDCTPGQLDSAMALLEKAQAMPVAPPLQLDPQQVALETLGEQALDHLRQPGELYDEQARACLKQAAKVRAFDVEQAMQAGQKLAAAEEPMADAGQVVAGLESLEAAPWPDDLLSRRALALLPDAYYRLCQQGDDAGCQGFARVADLLQPGETVEDEYQSGVEKPFYFQGQRGQAVTIAMDAVNNAFDTVVRLADISGGELTSNDDNGRDQNSLISAFILPKDGIYRILPGAFSGQGRYRLSLAIDDPRPIALGAAESSSTAQDSLWQFEGQAGQVVGISLDTTDPKLRSLSHPGADRT
ncbi:MAG: PPC domain-containing protein [Anaerolineae bacterium]